MTIEIADETLFNRFFCFTDLRQLLLEDAQYELLHRRLESSQSFLPEILLPIDFAWTVFERDDGRNSRATSCIVFESLGFGGWRTKAPPM